MKPKKVDFEKLKTGEFIIGAIEEVQRDEQHKSVWDKVEKISDCVRFKFKFDGYNYAHYSRWMSFNYGEKANLFSKYLIKLVAGAEPDMDFDIKSLEGMRVKTVWSEKNGFQSVDSIFPEKEMLVREALPAINYDEHEEPPF